MLIKNEFGNTHTFSMWMEQLEELILGVLDGMDAEDDMMLFIYPTNSGDLYDVELRWKDARVRFEVIVGRIPMVSIVENRRFDADWVRRFQSELIDMLY